MTLNFDNRIIVAILVVIYLRATFYVWKRWVRPMMETFKMKEVDRNPKWVMRQLVSYYGFEDIDFVLFDSGVVCSPRLKTNKTRDRLELWLPCDTLTKDVPELGRIALACKLHVRYGVWYPDKPIYWLSVLLFMLDGGEIRMEDRPKPTEKELKQETS